MVLSSHIWIDIFDHLEHPERIALGQIYPLYHQRWAERQAKYLLTHTNYLSHHSLESLTQVLLSARIELDHDAPITVSFLAQQERRFFASDHHSRNTESFIEDNKANRERLRQVTREMMEDKYHPLIPPVCPVLFVIWCGKLLVFDERRRVWIDNQLHLENVRLFSMKLMGSTFHCPFYFINDQGDLWGMMDEIFHGAEGGLMILLDTHEEYITHLSDGCLVKNGQVVPMQGSMGHLTRIRVGQTVTIFQIVLYHERRTLLVVGDEEGCRLILSVPSRELQECPLAQLKRVTTTYCDRIVAQLPDDSLVEISYRIDYDKTLSEVKIKPILPQIRGQLVTCLDRTFLFHEGSYSQIYPKGGDWSLSSLKGPFHQSFGEGPTLIQKI